MVVENINLQQIYENEFKELLNLFAENGLPLADAEIILAKRIFRLGFFKGVRAADDDMNKILGKDSIEPRKPQSKLGQIFSRKGAALGS